MATIFLEILNMSIAASWLVLAVIALRLLLKKAPKWITVMLWGLVGFRLICPFSFESVFSLIPSAETVSDSILYLDKPTIDSGIAAVNSAINPLISTSFASAVEESANPIQLAVFAASSLWMWGIVAMLVYTAVSCIRMHKKVREAVPFKDNIRVCDRVVTPFIFGVIRPRIYLPSVMNEQDTKYVIAHEKAHLKRHDHWWKPLGFLLLTVYWFNPLLWIAYVLLCRDIELACDEKVIRDMGEENKKPYSEALIDCNIPGRTIAACPLAFGEVSVKKRVKSVLNYKKPAFWIIVVAVVLCIIAAVCFLTNPKITVDKDLAAFIDNEIASHYRYADSEKNFCCSDCEFIGKESDDGLTTIYMWVLYEEFSNEDGLTHETGVYAFTAITVEETDGNYRLVEYWEAEDGINNSDSIMEKTPMYLWGKALDPLRYIDTQAAKLEKEAIKHFGITNATIVDPYSSQNDDID